MEANIKVLSRTYACNVYNPINEPLVQSLRNRVERNERSIGFSMSGGDTDIWILSDILRLYYPFKNGSIRCVKNSRRNGTNHDTPLNLKSSLSYFFFCFSYRYSF